MGLTTDRIRAARHTELADWARARAHEFGCRKFEASEYEAKREIWNWSEGFTYTQAVQFCNTLRVSGFKAVVIKYLSQVEKNKSRGSGVRFNIPDTLLDE
jgi:hypothetical protein